jgi:uncharacterized protein involved in outer membrane biogenesis
MASTRNPAHRRWWMAPALGLAVLAGAALVCEALGWPFLVEPIQRRVASALERRIELGDASERPRIGLIGSVRVTAHHVLVGAPSWSSTPHTFLAEDARVRLRYRDLWHAYRTGQLRIDALGAKRFDAQFERRADGRASWEFKPHRPSSGGSVTDLPVFGHLHVDDGSFVLRDAQTPLRLTARYALDDGTAPSPAASKASAPGEPQAPVHGLSLVGEGRYKTEPLKVEAQTEGVLMLEGDGARGRAQPLRIDALVGEAKVVFSGSVQDPLHLDGLRGSFEVGGPSLAAAGAPLGVTLPSTPRFDLHGRLAKDGEVWNAILDEARIGTSRLHGAFVFDKRRDPPWLSGRLEGARLALSDLGPAIGHAGAATAPGASQKSGRLLPTQTFDLPSLKVMNANVLFDLAQLDLGTSVLEPLQPARAHLTLQGGVLRLQDLDLRTAHGRLGGSLVLDSRVEPALWKAALDLRGLELEQFLHLQRQAKDPPYISGRLDAELRATGRGRSVAQILGDSQGSVLGRLDHGALSHLALKAAGLDVAGGIKVLVKGDEPLAVHCGVADLDVQKGVVRPKPVVLSLDNATLWADGYIALADEQMDVRTVSAPKDLTPVSLRTPIEVKGTLAKPSISLDPSRVVARAGAAVLLGLLNPLAAVVPFIDPGARDAAHRADTECAAIAQRAEAHRLGRATSAPPGRAG